MLGALEILHRDERFLVVAKPSGLSVHPGWARDGETLVDLLGRALARRVHPVHRLDRGTSGLLLVALDRETAAALHGDLEAGRMDKRYLALVRGIPPVEAVIDHPIPRREGGPRVPALTEIRRLATFERFALVEARPRTGRLHQVRRHLKHLSHPILGDVNYGRGELNRLFRERFGLYRLALHASHLSFAHPTENRIVRVTAPIPADLREPLLRMGFSSGTLDAIEAASGAAGTPSLPAIEADQLLERRGEPLIRR